MKSYNIYIGELILQKLKEKERTIFWLAQKVHTDNSNLSKTLKSSRYIYLDLLMSISIALEEDFFAYYSEELKEEMKNWSNSPNIMITCIYLCCIFAQS